VLRFDPASGAYVGRVQLPNWNPREVVLIGSDAYTFHGNQLVQLDPTRLEPGATVTTAVPLSGLAKRNGEAWALTLAGTRGVIEALDVRTGAVDRERSRVLPRGFTALGLQAVGQQLWVRGQLHDHQIALVRVDVGDEGRPTVAKTVVMRTPDTTSDLVVMRDGTIVVAADGRLQRFRLGS
jgi:hypothetical protein